RAAHAAPRGRRGAGRPARRLPPVPDPRRQPVSPARHRGRRRGPARQRHRHRRSRGAPRLPRQAAHGAARGARHRARGPGAHAGVRAAMMRAALSLLAIVLAAPSVAGPRDDATVALNFQDVELPVLAHFVSEVTGRNFIVDERVHGKVTIISPTRLTPDEAYLVFQSVLQVKGFSTVPSGAVTKIVPARDALGSGGPSAQTSDEAVTRRLPLVHAAGAALGPVLQPLVSKDGVLTAYPPTNHLLVVDAGSNVERVARTAADLDRPATERSAETLGLRYANAEELAARLRDAMGSDANGHRPPVFPDPPTPHPLASH